MNPELARSDPRDGWRLSFGESLSCRLALPQSVGQTTRVAVVVHGVSRNAQEHFQAFGPLAKACGWVLIAPMFDAETFPDYQRLGRPGKGARADLALIDLVSSLRTKFSLPDCPIHLFGHSGGAQFAHRFVLAHPDLVARYAISASGWYTFPDGSQDYPYGLAGAPAEFSSPGALEFLKIPGVVFVGSGDHRSGPTVRRNEFVDAQQGEHRLERAARWTQAMNAKARAIGLAEPLQLRLVEDGAHSFSGLVRRGRLHERAWAFLAQSEEEA